MTTAHRRPGRDLRVFYAAGPGHVIGTFIYWRAGQDDPSEPTVAYSGQFYDVCRELNARGYVVTACSHRGFLEEGQFRIEQRPYRLRSAGGILYHVGQLWNGLCLMARAIRFRSDVAIIAEGSHWFVFTPLALLGVKVVPALHNVVERRSGHSSVVRRLLGRCNGWFFANHCHAILSASQALTRQVASLTRGRHCQVIEFLPLYRRAAFEQVRAADGSARPFRVLFVGRIERSKGVFDLLTAAKQLASRKLDDIELHLCGDGSDLAALRDAAIREGVAHRFQCHGPCKGAELVRKYEECHVVIVPTRAELGEGFNQVTSEAILAGRPAIVSSECPAIEYVREAVTEVPAGDVTAYVEAILSYVNDLALFQAKQQAARTAAAQFYDESRSFGAGLRRVCESVSV
jgi:glycogen synthase